MQYSSSLRTVRIALFLFGYAIAAIGVVGMIACVFHPPVIFVNFATIVEVVTFGPSQLPQFSGQPILELKGTTGRLLGLVWALPDICVVLAALLIAVMAQHWRERQFFNPGAIRRFRLFTWLFLGAQLLYETRDFGLQLILVELGYFDHDIVFTVFGRLPLNIMFSVLLFTVAHLFRIAADIEDENNATI